MTALDMIAVIAPGALPSFIATAARKLANATSAAEVLDARDHARAAYDAAKAAARFARIKGAYDEVIVQIHSTQADALEIECAAKRRLAEEYDAAQERGEVRANGRPNFSDEGKVTAAEIGLTPKEIHEARELREAEDADPGVTRRTLDDLMKVSAEPTKAALKRVILKRPLIDHGARDPEDFNRAMNFKGMVESYADELGGWNLDDLIPRLIERDKAKICALINLINEIHGDVMQRI